MHYFLSWWMGLFVGAGLYLMAYFLLPSTPTSNLQKKAQAADPCNQAWEILSHPIRFQTTENDYGTPRLLVKVGGMDNSPLDAKQRQVVTACLHDVGASTATESTLLSKPLQSCSVTQSPFLVSFQSEKKRDPFGLLSEVELEPHTEQPRCLSKWVRLMFHLAHLKLAGKELAEVQNKELLLAAVWGDLFMGIEDERSFERKIQRLGSLAPHDPLVQKYVAFFLHTRLMHLQRAGLAIQAPFRAAFLNAAWALRSEDVEDPMVMRLQMEALFMMKMGGDAFSGQWNQAYQQWKKDRQTLDVARLQPWLNFLTTQSLEQKPQTVNSPPRALASLAVPFGTPSSDLRHHFDLEFLDLEIVYEWETADKQMRAIEGVGLGGVLIP